MNRQTLLRRFYRTRISGGDPIREALDGLQFQLSPGGELNWKTFPGEINPSIIQRYGSGRPYFNDFDLLTAQQTYVSPAMATPNAYLINANSGWRSFEDFILSLNPTAYWPLDDAPGSTVARDASGHNYTGIVTGSVTFGSPSLTTFGETSATFSGGTIALPALPDTADFTLIYLSDCTNNISASANIPVFAQGSFTGKTGFTFFKQTNGTTISDNVINQFSNGAVSIVDSASPGLVAGGNYGSTNFLSVAGGSIQTVANTGYVYSPENGIAAVPSGFPYASAYLGRLGQIAVFDYVFSAAQIAAIQSVLSSGPLYGIFARNGV